MTGLAQVQDDETTFSVDKMPNREVIGYVEEFEDKKWHWIAVDPPIEMTDENVTLSSSVEPL